MKDYLLGTVCRMHPNFASTQADSPSAGVDPPDWHMDMGEDYAEAEPPTISPPDAERSNGYLVRASAGACESFGETAINATLDLHDRAMAEQHLDPVAVIVEEDDAGQMVCAWCFDRGGADADDVMRRLRAAFSSFDLVLRRDGRFRVIVLGKNVVGSGGQP